MLAIDNLCVSIGGSRILRDVTMELPDSKVFCLMGRNGVGKTTTLKTVVGLYKASSGSIRLDGKDISRMPAEASARAGIGYVPQGRGIFPHLTVEENLFVGAVAQGKKPKRTPRAGFRSVPNPEGISAAQRRHALRRPAATAGDRPRPLTEPKVLILDEPTEGIQPNIIDQIGEAIRLLRRGGHHNEAMLLAEAAQSLKKLKEEGKHPKPELLETLAEQIKTLQRDGAHRTRAPSSRSVRHSPTCARKGHMRALCSKMKSRLRSTCSPARAR